MIFPFSQNFIAYFYKIWIENSTNPIHHPLVLTGFRKKAGKLFAVFRIIALRRHSIFPVFEQKKTAQTLGTDKKASNVGTRISRNPMLVFLTCPTKRNRTCPFCRQGKQTKPTDRPTELKLKIKLEKKITDKKWIQVLFVHCKDKPAPTKRIFGHRKRQ